MKKINRGYQVFREFCELRIKQREEGLGPKEETRLREIEIGGKDDFTKLVFFEVIGTGIYTVGHPVDAYKAVFYSLTHRTL